jgi:hypothetical protein
MISICGCEVLLVLDHDGGDPSGEGSISRFTVTPGIMSLNRNPGLFGKNRHIDADPTGRGWPSSMVSPSLTVRTEPAGIL